MSGSEDFLNQSVSYADAARQKMAEHDLPPTPINYSVWYAYYSNSVPGLKQMLDVLISNKRVITEELCSELYEHYFSHMDDGLVIQDAGMRLQHEVSRLMKWLDGASDNADDFGASLKSNMGELGEPEGLRNLRKIMESLLTESRKAHQSNEMLKAKLEESSSEINNLRENLASVQKEALTDALTGIANRKQFDMMLRNQAMHAMEEGHNLCLALVDIDFFKKFNDTYGHQVGDKVLKLVAEMLSSNIKGRDLAARYGGEEFAILLPKTELEDGVALCEQIRISVESKVLRSKHSGEDYGKITISIGVGEFEPGESLDQLINRADECLYRAKDSGRNRVVAGNSD